MFSHSFVVCAYGESPYLKECIESILNQTRLSRIIISTSTDNAYIMGLAKDYSLPVFVNKESRGIAADWNYALAHANTRYVTIAHQDDVYEKNYVEELQYSLSQSKDTLIYFTNYGEIRKGLAQDSNILLNVKRVMLAPIRFGRFGKVKWIRRRILSVGSPICCPSVTYNLDLIKQPIFEQDMKCDLDWQAWEKLSKEEGCFFYNPKILMRHRIHEESETSHLIKNNIRGSEDLEMLKKFWPGCLAESIYKLYALSQKSNRD